MYSIPKSTVKKNPEGSLLYMWGPRETARMAQDRYRAEKFNEYVCIDRG